MKLGELFYELNFHPDTSKLEDFIKGVGKLDMSSIMALAGLSGLYVAVKNIMESASNAGMEMNRFSVITGMSAQQMDSWKKAAEQAGVEGDAVASTFKHIQDVQAKAAMNKPDTSFLQGLYILNSVGKAGINLYDNAAKMQEKIVIGLDKLDDSQKRNVLSLMGINEQMLLFYKNKELFGKRNEQAVLNTDEVKVLVEYWKQIKEIGQGIATITGQIGAELAMWTKPLVDAISFLTKAEAKYKTLTNTVRLVENLIPTTGNIMNWNNMASDMIWRGIQAFIPQSQQGNQVPNITANLTFHGVGASAEDIKEKVHFALRDSYREAMSTLPGKSI